MCQSNPFPASRLAAYLSHSEFRVSVCVCVSVFVYCNKAYLINWNPPLN